MRSRNFQGAGIMPRAQACASANTDLSEYDLPMHVGALFIVLFTSFTACIFPLLAVKFRRLRIPTAFLFWVRHFGTGVLIATAFVHLLPTAFISLTDPCLPLFWNETYPEITGAIAMVAVFFVVICENVFSGGRHVCGSMQDIGAICQNAPVETHQHRQSRDLGSGEAYEIAAISNTTNSIPEPAKEPSSQGFGIVGPRRANSSTTARELQRLSRAQLPVAPLLSKLPKPTVQFTAETQLTSEQRYKKQLLQCMLLEMGILFHSIFIGMALSVTVGSDFIVLLIAIVFHQTFEGLALGSRIASLDWPSNKLQPWWMALAYGCTTPVGQAIGLGVHTLYEPASETGLLVVGIMNAISAGLLIFASLVELLAEDFLSDESWRVMRGRKRVLAFFLMFLGAVGMSVIGAWA